MKSKGLSDEAIEPPNTSNNSRLTPSLDYFGTKTRVTFSGSCLKQDKITFAQKTIINIYIVYEINRNHTISSYPTLGNRLLGAFKLTKNIDIDKYKYSGYGIGFDS